MLNYRKIHLNSTTLKVHRNMDKSIISTIDKSFLM